MKECQLASNPLSQEPESNTNARKAMDKCMVRSTNAKLGALGKDIASIQGKTVTWTPLLEAREGQEFDLYEVSELVERTFLDGQANIARRYAPIMNILNQVVGDSKKAHHALNRRPMAKLFGAKGLKKGRGTG